MDDSFAVKIIYGPQHLQENPFDLELRDDSFAYEDREQVTTGRQIPECEPDMSELCQAGNKIHSLQAMAYMVLRDRKAR